MKKNSMIIYDNRILDKLFEGKLIDTGCRVYVIGENGVPVPASRDYIIANNIMYIYKLSETTKSFTAMCVVRYNANYFKDSKFIYQGKLYTVEIKGSSNYDRMYNNQIDAIEITSIDDPAIKCVVPIESIVKVTGVASIYDRVRDRIKSIFKFGKKAESMKNMYDFLSKNEINNK